MSEIVVFLPGIMGSELWLEGERIWPGPAASLIAPYQRMEELLRPELQATGVIRRFSVFDQYQGLIDDLGSFGFAEGQRLLLFPYDWRKSNVLAAERLADQLDVWSAAHAGASITLLAHSMGGLICRYYLESGRFASREGHRSVRRLIMMGTPQRGAPLALSAAVGKEKRLFLSAEQVLRLARDPRYPSLYQLLPPAGEPFAHDGGFGRKLDPIDIYNGTKASALALVPANLESARSFHAGLDFASRPAGVRYFLLYGSHQKTIAAALLDLDARSPVACVTNLDLDDAGDGTVPLWSGMAAGLEGRVVGGSHGTLYKNLDVRRVLASLFAYDGTLAAEHAVEVAVRNRVVEPASLLHVSLSLGPGVSNLSGALHLERATVHGESDVADYAPAGKPQLLTYTGANAERIAVTLDAPDLAGLYRLSFRNPDGLALGQDEFFVQDS